MPTDFFFRIQFNFRVDLSSSEANLIFLLHFGCIEADVSSFKPGLAVRVELRTSER